MEVVETVARPTRSRLELWASFPFHSGKEKGAHRWGAPNWVTKIFPLGRKAPVPSVRRSVAARVDQHLSKIGAITYSPVPADPDEQGQV